MLTFEIIMLTFDLNFAACQLNYVACWPKLNVNIIISYVDIIYLVGVDVWYHRTVAIFKDFIS